MNLRSCLVATGLLVLLGCAKRTTVVSPISCHSTQQYAKTVNEAAARLLGNWRLTSMSVGFGQPPTVPNQTIKFEGGGSCVITRDGVASAPVSYVLDLRSSTWNPAPLPHLAVRDSTLADLPFYRLGTGLLLICDEEFVIDYGSAVDGPAYTYRRQVK